MKGVKLDENHTHDNGTSIGKIFGQSVYRI